VVLEEWLSEQLLVRFAERIVPIDADVVLTWGKLMGALEVMGKTMPAIDSLIAASTLHGNFVLVTRNEGDFAHAGIQVVNPWE
jgi:predicted nucleic acid-binding protein